MGNYEQQVFLLTSTPPALPKHTKYQP